MLLKRGIAFYLTCHSRERDCVTMTKRTINIVIPAEAGIQNLLILLDSVSRFACTE